MYAEYDNETLKKLQKFELGILADFVRVCEENNLTYFGFAGTGIGALRHGGFIPWDDDIDVAMPRKDYQKLIDIFKKTMTDKYTVLTAEDYDDFPIMNTHIIINGSAFITSEEKKLRYPKGIFLDIFPLDNTYSDEKRLKKHAYKTWFLNKLLIIKHIPLPHLPYKGIVGFLCHCVTATAWFFMKVFHITHRFIYSRLLKSSSRYNDSEGTDALAFFCGTRPFDVFFLTEDVYPLRKEHFENMELCFPKNLEKHLKSTYGDFMKLPPVEKRKNHCPDVIEFPKSENE